MTRGGWLRALITHDMRRWSCSVCNFEISSTKSLARLKGDYKVKLADGDEDEDEGKAKATKDRRGRGGDCVKFEPSSSWSLGHLDSWMCFKWRNMK